MGSSLTSVCCKRICQLTFFLLRINTASQGSLGYFFSLKREKKHLKKHRKSISFNQKSFQREEGQ